MTFSSNEPLNTNQLPISIDVNPDEPGYQSILQLYLRRVANAVNTKESGLFLLQENASFEQWFNNTTQVSGYSQQNRNGYRLTVDLVALNLAINMISTIPTGTTNNLTLDTTTVPIAPIGYLYPVQGFGGAIDSNGLSYFLNDPDLYVRYNGSTNTFIIVNNTGSALTWCVFVIEFLKN